MIVLTGTGTFSVCLPSLHSLFGSLSLAAIIRSTRSFFRPLSSKSKSGIQLRDPDGSDAYDNPECQHDGRNEQIRVLKTARASSGKSSKRGNLKAPRKTPSQEHYLMSTTETYAISDVRLNDTVLVAVGTIMKMV